VENYVYNQILNSKTKQDPELSDKILSAANANKNDRKMSDFTSNLSHTIKKIANENNNEELEEIFNKEMKVLQESEKNKGIAIINIFIDAEDNTFNEESNDPNYEPLTLKQR